jgi:Pyridoxamine 5'-phosphate oxidase
MGRNRIRVRRQPRRGLYDRESINAVLDAGLVAHLAFVDSGQPYCIPMLYARTDDSVYVHGSTASRTIRTLASVHRRPSVVAGPGEWNPAGPKRQCADHSWRRRGEV